MMAKQFRPQVLLLIVLNLLLASLLGYEVTAMQQQPTAATVETEDSLELAVAAKGKAGVTRSREDYAEITNRPLFNKERRPLVQEASELSEEETRAFTLVGVVLTPEQQVAILYSRRQQQPVKVALWDWIEGWRLISVEANLVKLRKGKNTLELALQRNSQTGAEQ